MAVLSFFSGSYCRADDVIAGVAKQLEFERITNAVYEEACRHSNVNLDKLTRALYGPDPFFNRFTHEREELLATMRVVLAERIALDNVIVEGCIGHLIPRTMAHVLRVCLIANHDFRVRQVMDDEGKSEKEAGALIHEDDKRNFGCTTYLLDKSAYDESLYDTVIPMHDTSIEEAVEKVIQLAGSEPVRTTERSRLAAADFVLSAKISLALAGVGQKAEVHCEDGNAVLLINEYVVRMKRHEEKLAEIAHSVDGVRSVTTRLGPKYQAPSINPWSNIEGPPKIMLVDDEKEFVHTLSDRLRTRHLESSIAYDGEQALEMLKEDVPDVMVLDLMMPGIDGIETLRRIKSGHPEVEVIILTGHGSDREQQLAEELGAFAYLQKPVNIEELARVMREAYKKANRGNVNSGDEGSGTGSDD